MRQSWSENELTAHYGATLSWWLHQQPQNHQHNESLVWQFGHQLEMCAGQNLQERERKETRSRLKKIFLLPVLFRFFPFLERVFPLFPIFLGISHPVLRRSFPVFSSFHLSKPVPSFLMGLKLAILERVLNETLCKPVPRRSLNRSSPFLKSFLVFPQPVFLSNKEKREPRTASILKNYILASVQ